MTESTVEGEGKKNGVSRVEARPRRLDSHGTTVDVDLSDVKTERFHTVCVHGPERLVELKDRTLNLPVSHSYAESFLTSIRSTSSFVIPARSRTFLRRA